MIWYSVAEMPNAVKRPMHGDSWGSWTYDEETLALNYRTRAGWDYHVDLEKITDCDQLIEWIFHISQKNGYDVENLVKALGDLLGPRGTLFRSGNFNPTAWLRRPRKDEVSVMEYRKIWEEFREAHRDPQDDLIEPSPESPEHQQNEEMNKWNSQARESRAAKSKRIVWETGTELQQKESKTIKTLKTALNRACPAGMVETPYDEIKEHLHVAWGIDLNDIPNSTVCRVRKTLGIETTGGVNPAWLRPVKGELCPAEN